MKATVFSLPFANVVRKSPFEGKVVKTFEKKIYIYKCQIFYANGQLSCWKHLVCRLANTTVSLYSLMLKPLTIGTRWTFPFANMCCLKSKLKYLIFPRTRYFQCKLNKRLHCSRVFVFLIFLWKTNFLQNNVQTHQHILNSSDIGWTGSKHSFALNHSFLASSLNSVVKILLS